LDIDHARWVSGLNWMQDANVQIAQGRKQGGVGGWLKRMAGSAKAGMGFVSLLMIPVEKNAVPESPRLEPAY